MRDRILIAGEEIRKAERVVYWVDRKADMEVN
jgi:hypothetical protein